MEKHIRKNGEGECWWSRIASPYPDANKVAPPATNDFIFIFPYYYYLFFTRRNSYFSHECTKVALGQEWIFACSLCCSHRCRSALRRRFWN